MRGEEFCNVGAGVPDGPSGCVASAIYIVGRGHTPPKPADVGSSKKERTVRKLSAPHLYFLNIRLDSAIPVAPPKPIPSDIRKKINRRPIR